MTSRFSCPRCASADVQTLPHDSARCRACLHTFRTDGWNAAPDTRDTRPDPRIDAYRDALAAAPDDMTALRALWAQDDAADSEPVYACACGQTTITPGATCAACLSARNAAPAAPERLFEPAPTPMPGQIMGRWDPYQ